MTRRSIAVVSVLASALIGSAAARGPAATRGPILTFARDGALYDLAVEANARPRRLAGVIAPASQPAWSADGRKLAYVSSGGGDADIVVYDRVTRTSRPVTADAAEDTLPDWSPDGRRLAFASNRGGPFQVWVMQADGTGERQVTRIGAPAYGAFYPAWSPDGRTIAFATAGRTPENQEIYTVRPDGTGLRRLTFTAGDAETLGDDAAPAWTPDGRQLIFASNREGGLGIWRMRADGSRQRALVDLARRDDGSPAVSPDGGLVAFDSRDPLGRVRIGIVRTDGTGARLSLPGEAPAWRPAAS